MDQAAQRVLERLVIEELLELFIAGDRATAAREQGL